MHPRPYTLFKGDITLNSSTPDSIVQSCHKVYTPRSGVNEIWGDITVADIDNNGWNDIIFQVLGEKSINILYQETELSFREAFIEHNWYGTTNGIRGPQMDVGDLDLDGDIDLVVPDNHPQDRDLSWYENIEGKLYRHYFNGELPGIYMSKTADVDRDGDLDILVTVGKDQVVENEILLFEASDDRITQNWVIHDSIDNPQDLELAYIDNDDYIDVVVVEKDAGKLIWLQNNQTKYAWEAQEIDRNLLNPQGIATGDLEQDGKEDVVLASMGDNSILVYQNQGDGLFTKEIIGEQIIAPIEIELFDWEQDGDLDVVIVCENVNAPLVILKNTDSNFERVTVNLPEVWGTDLEIADWDGDLLPDILVSTTSSLSAESGQVYFLKNEGNTFQTIRVFETEFTIETLSTRKIDPGESIDLLLGFSAAAPNQVEVGFNRLGSVETTYPLSSAQGTVGSINVMDVNGDSIPEVFFADKTNKALNQITIDPLIFSSDSTSNDSSAQNVDSLFSRLAFAGYGLNRGSVAWGDYDNDNDLDLLVTGVKTGVEEEKVGTVFRNDGANRFFDASISLPKVSHGEAQWIDYTLDNRLDIVIGGLTEAEQPILALYKQSPTGIFEPDTTFLTSETFCLAWGDLNQDGAPDLVQMNDNGIQLYLNKLDAWENANSISLDFDLPSLSGCSVKLFDFNNDHTLDIALVAETATQKLFRLFKNTGDAQFEPILRENLFGLGSDPSVDIGDYNADGFPDILISGDDTENIPRVWIYENQNGSDDFTLKPLSIEGVERGQAIWGDLDNDGNLDVVLSGRGTSGNPLSLIYQGLPDGTYRILYDGLISIDRSHTALGDFNKDKKLDIAAVGINYPDGINTPQFQLYQNQTFTANTPPKSPSNLREVFHTDGSITLIWDPGTDAQTSTKGLSYNLYLGSAEGTTDIISPESNLANGFRKVPKLGNVQQNTSWTIHGVEPGEYYWGVQSIDGSFEGSTFAHKSFSFFDPNETPDLSVSSVVINPSKIEPGDSITVNIVLENLGLVGVSSHQLGLYLSEDSMYNPGDGFLGIITLSAVEGLSGQSLDTSFQVPLNLIGQGTNTYYVFAIADPFNEVHPELSEDNNTGFALLEIGALVPQLSIDPLSPEIRDQEIDLLVTLQDIYAVDSAKILYRGICTPEESPWNISYAVEINSDSVLFVLQPEWADPQGLEYQIQLEVNEGDALNSEIQYLYRYYEEPGITFSDLPGANPGGFNTPERNSSYEGAYRIISVPLNLADPSISSVFEENLGNYNKKEWRLFQYIPISNVFQEYQAGLSEVSPGEGLFFIQKESNSIQTGAGRTVEANRNKPFSVSLKAGCNVIGNPYNLPIDWEKVIALNPQADFQEELIIHEGGYKPAMEIKAYRGAFVWVSEDVTIDLPIAAIGPKRIGNKSYSSLDQPRWEVPLTLRSSHNTYELGGIGMHPDAQISRDPKDRFTPPRFLDYLELNFYHPEFMWERFTKEVVPTAGSYIWEFVVESSDSLSSGILSWDNSFFGENDKELWLYDVEAQFGVDMRNQSEYGFQGLGNHRFHIYFGNLDQVLSSFPIQTIRLGMPYPNPAAKYVKIPVFIPDGYSEEANVIISNALGQQVFTHKISVSHPGSYEFEWNLPYMPGGRESSGMYFIQLREGENQVQTRTLFVR